MSLGAWFGNNPIVMGVVAAGVFVLALTIILTQMTGNGLRGGQEYFYDMDTGRLFTDAAEGFVANAPDDEGEAEGVLAHVFACGACPDTSLAGMTLEEVEQAGAFVHYVEGLRADDDGPVRQDDRRIVARVDELDQWYPAMSPRGRAIIEEPLERCSDEPVQMCLP